MIKYSETMFKREAKEKGYKVINFFSNKSEAEEVAKSFDRKKTNLLIVREASGLYYLMSK